MLLVGGCSYVWGEELEGSYDNPKTHHKHTFTCKLAEKLGIPSVNLGCPGNGNQKIFRDVIDYLDSPAGKNVTHMVVIWSYWGREEFAESINEEEESQYRLQRHSNMSLVSPNRSFSLKQPLRDKYESIMHEEGYKKSQIIRSLSFMKSLKLIAEAKGIHLIQGIFHSTNWKQIVEILADKDKNYRSFRGYIKRTLGSLPPHHKLGMQGCFDDMDTWADKNNYGKCKLGHHNEKTHESYANLLQHIFRKTIKTKLEE